MDQWYAQLSCYYDKIGNINDVGVLLTVRADS